MSRDRAEEGGNHKKGQSDFFLRLKVCRPWCFLSIGGREGFACPFSLLADNNTLSLFPYVFFSLREREGGGRVCG